MRLPAVLLDVFATTLFSFVLYTLMAAGVMGERGESTALPVDLSPEAPQTGVGLTASGALVISLLATGEGRVAVRVDGRGVTLEALPAALCERAPAAVEVQVDGMVRFHDLARLMALLVDAGIPAIHLATRKG
jgi:biopolymer transport protein ExbD